MGVISYLFSSDNARHLKKLNKIADKVMALEENYLDKTDGELRACTVDFQERYKAGESLNDLLPEAFAVVREASSRVLKMRHFYTQIIGGIVLHQGRIAEMRTGEGKTLVATLPAYLNAITGEGVHVVTVNEYLAKRDADWMGKVYKFLGLSVGVILNSQNIEQKRANYACDITYCTNNELGFDYLRDNMVVNAKSRCGRGYAFCIVDEVDSILIDEARTPLIISGSGSAANELYEQAEKFYRTLNKDDYEYDEKTKQVLLTDSGVHKAEKYFKIDNIGDVNALTINHHIINALKAHLSMIKNINYIVKDDEVQIVDEFTGRILAGRRFSNGLHQAIEMKENVKIKNENKTYATITFQNYFKLYKKLSGMTGTAKTEEAEFNKIYSLDVVTIPTNKVPQRIDEQDLVFFTFDAKMRAIVDEIKEKNEKNQPILIGTASIQKSEDISKALKAAKIKHNLLNAKNHERESYIISQAGRLGAVTIATNMAGRGTDISLGGNAETMTHEEMVKKGVDAETLELITSFEPELTDEQNQLLNEYNQLLVKNKEKTDAERALVLEAGGLHIIGTERHESRRIDNQLRGRAGRQGDKGSSVFFISLEDDLAQRFGEDKFKNMFKIVFKGNQDLPLQAKILSNFFENAQKRTEQHFFAMRRQVLEFDNVMNKQREIIYTERNKVLDGENVHNQMMDMIKEFVENACYEVVDDTIPFYELDLEKINHKLENNILPKETNLVTEKFVEECDLASFTQKVYEAVVARIDEKKLEFEKVMINTEATERRVLLSVVDMYWRTHIDEIDTLRNEIFTQSYGQKDPVVVFKQDSFDMFDQMINHIRKNAAIMCLNFYRANIKIEIRKKDAVQTAKPNTQPVQKAGTFIADKKIDRNALCPCGSGKKYKNCCQNKESEEK